MKSMKIIDKIIIAEQTMTGFCDYWLWSIIFLVIPSILSASPNNKNYDKDVLYKQNRIIFGETLFVGVNKIDIFYGELG